MKTYSVYQLYAFVVCRWSCAEFSLPAYWTYCVFPNTAVTAGCNGCEPCEGRGYFDSRHADYTGHTTCSWCNGTGRAQRKKPYDEPTCPHGQPLHQDCFKCEEVAAITAGKLGT